jgi:hypothetical protein
MLNDVRPGLDEASSKLLDHFGWVKGELDSAGEGADQVGF